MSVIGSNILAGASGQGGGYNLTKSLRFRSSASAYLNRTPASAGNRKTWTWSAWIKRGTISAASNMNLWAAGSSGSDEMYFQINTSDQLRLSDNTFNYFVTSQVFRDPSAWYHIILAFDSTQATGSNRIKLYVNGSQVTAFATNNISSITLNGDYAYQNTVAQTIGRQAPSASGYYDGYTAEINNIDGQALTPSSFGETSTTTGVWIPKKYTGTYGTNGFYLPFTDTTSTSTLGTDFSGNSNTWTVNNISLTAGSTYDSMTDVPTLTSATTANYAVMNPLRPFGGSLSNGNLTAVTGNSGSANSGFVTSTVWLPTSGKFYFEATPTTVSDIAIGLTTDSNIRAAMYYRGGDIYINGSVTTSQASYTNNDVIGVAVDIGGATVQFYKNNAAQGTAQSISVITAPLVASLAQLSGSSSATAEVNFGQRPFTYTPPSGFVALNTYNLPTPTIGATASTTANEYFDVTTYTGNGGTLAVTNSGSMQPDFVWLKSRSAAYDHLLFDSIRGTGKALFSSSTAVETTTNNMSAFNSNGFTALYDATYIGSNNSGVTMVGWQWRASNATAVTNTAGSITSTVSASTTAGFSVVTWTGTGVNNATVGHGLGVTPAMIIVKNRTLTYNWDIYHQSLGITATLIFTTAATRNVNAFGTNNPTSSVFSVYDSYTNTSASNYVAYCFAQIAGYSAFGSYTGNNSSDGPFIFTGFRPRFVLFKNASAGSQWILLDTARNTYNVSNAYLEPNTPDTENTASNVCDILSNGFKIRTTGTDFNDSSNTYIYMAFAENPFKYSNAR